MTILRHSSRTSRLDNSFLLKHLAGARSYKRIAGYFTSSLFEVADELIEQIPSVQIVCNSDIHPQDLLTAKQCEARMLGRWNETTGLEQGLLKRPRYRRLDSFLEKHGQAIRVAPDSVCGFVHGKAGVIECADGRKLGFIGSMNESRNGWQRHYEILWEDDSTEGVEWIEAEFKHLWDSARVLPDLIIKEVKRQAHRREVSFRAIDDDEQLAPAALIECPLYREGNSLQPWQQGFVSECIRHHQNHGTVRLLLADEVGLGKTLSLGTAALALCLLMERDNKRRKPVLIFAPATLCIQWQIEMEDKLGIPCARWLTQQKAWSDPADNIISGMGTQHIAQCPLRIGIISTGLMSRASEEKAILLNMNFGLVIVDEAHKARSRQGFGRDAGEPNALLAFIREIAGQSQHVLLGTATPIQTQSDDLWDLMGILHQGEGNFVLGHDHSPWHYSNQVLPLVTGSKRINDPEEGWGYLRSPLPAVNESTDADARKLYRTIHEDLGSLAKIGRVPAFSELDTDTVDELEDALRHDLDGASFFQRENPFVRHVVLRKRSTLEAKNLIPKIAVDVHPNSSLVKDERAFDALFSEKALRVEDNFREAYNEAQAFAKALSARGKGAGFMKNLLEQRICSSIHAGITTAQRLLEGETVDTEGDDEDGSLLLNERTAEEEQVLKQMIDRLQRIDNDPKLQAIIHYLENEKWLNYGVIIFSQYYDTAAWVAQQLALRYQDLPIGLYAGASRSKLFNQGESVHVLRDSLKNMVANRELTIMVATDAACEGLNLQTLGTLINVDLPWNPTRLEQRIGRIKRFGQVRDRVDMLNLVNAETVDETVYNKLSERMQDRYDIFGSLPDTIKDDWIENVENIDESMDEYIDAQRQATGFELRYNDTLDADAEGWRNCSDVLSRQNFQELMREGWKAR